MSPYTNERDTSSFGGLLRRLRAAAGLSQEELALRAGLSVPGVGALERGERRRPHLHTVTALADALGISEEERAALVGARERGPDAPAKSPAFRPPAPPTPL